MCYFSKYISDVIWSRIMSIKVFRVTEKIPDRDSEFVDIFLKSSDFDGTLRKQLCRGLNLKVSDKKEKQAQAIASLAVSADTARRNEIRRLITHALIQRPKRYLAFKYGQIREKPELSNPIELVDRRGEEQWYGPIHTEDNAFWYIRPMFITQLENIATDEEKKEYLVRWLCFARIKDNFLSLHWRNFTAGKNGLIYFNGKTVKGRFPYWEVVPKLFDEIQEYTRAKVETINLQNLILHSLWDQYRTNTNYDWQDLHIKAEHKGVALNAKTRLQNIKVGKSIKDDDETDDEDNYDDTIDIIGIRHLAHNIRKAVEHRLLKFSIKIPNPDEIDEEILRTLIREYDPQSYECIIREDSSQLFRAKTFFGTLNSRSEESLKHLLFTSLTHRRTDIDLFSFLLQHFDPRIHLEDNTPRTLSMF